MLNAVDQSPVTRRQKLKLYKQGVCPRLNWLLTIEEFPISLIERNLEAPATRYLKRGQECQNQPTPTLSTWHKEKVVCNYQQFQLATRNSKFPNSLSCFCLVMPQCGSLLKKVSKMRWEQLGRASNQLCVQQLMCEDPSRARKALCTASKKYVAENDDKQRKDSLKAL